MYGIFRTPEFVAWYDTLDERGKSRVERRLLHIQAYEHFGDHKMLSGSAAKIGELRWKNGIRVYYMYIESKKILLLLGGNKNGQQKDIEKAKRIAKKHTEAVL